MICVIGHSVIILKKHEVLVFHFVNGEVVEEKPSDYEMSIFWRHFHDGGIISEEIAKALAINPGLSY